MQSPLLTHPILALTLLYDIHMTNRPDEKKTASLEFHFYNGVSLFKDRLLTA
jgi:hypothetical protein